MSTPLISIIIPVYNHAKELQKTLASIFGQTLICHSFTLFRTSSEDEAAVAAEDEGSLKESKGILRGVYLERSRRAQNDKQIEVIVVDDGSTDRIEEMLAKWNNGHKFATNRHGLTSTILFKFVRQSHQGAAAARNRGFRESQGKYVIFWDADLIARPEMLEKMLKALDDHPKVSYTYSSFKFGWKTFECGPFDAEKLRKMNYITTTSLIRREHFPGFDEALQKFQDWDLWLTMLEQGYIGCWVSEVLFTIKPRRAGISSWLPSFIYKFPWLPISALKKYQDWKKIVLEKHHLTKNI